NVPTISGSIVSSRTCTFAGIYGLNVASNGLVSDFAASTPTTSGNSFAPTLSVAIRLTSNRFSKTRRVQGLKTPLLYTGHHALSKRLQPQFPAFRGSSLIAKLFPVFEFRFP